MWSCVGLCRTSFCSLEINGEGWGITMSTIYSHILGKWSYREKANMAKYYQLVNLGGGQMGVYYILSTKKFERKVVFIES